jgi:hypothetical protein
LADGNLKICDDYSENNYLNKQILNKLCNNDMKEWIKIIHNEQPWTNKKSETINAKITSHLSINTNFNRERRKSNIITDKSLLMKSPRMT